MTTQKTTPAKQPGKRHWLEAELNWLRDVIRYRTAQHTGSPEALIDDRMPVSPSLAGGPYAAFVAGHELDDRERLVLILALTPHIAPYFLDDVIQQALNQNADFPQIGGVRSPQFRAFHPTGETALFLLAGEQLTERLSAGKLFSSDHLFARKKVLALEELPAIEPRMSGRLALASEYVDLFTHGRISRPRFSLRFPAQLIETQMEWKDLVLNPLTLRSIRELEAWVNHGETLMKDWGMGKRLKPGYRALFYGPPGTGKTFTATLLGKYTGKDVYRIDLSMVVSKFIGETEKNLANLFARAESKDWILFFDEADALFGKRTNVRDAHDKYANQEVSYLLQRVEEYDGLVILATNFKTNIDEAFLRRFQSIIHFPPPRESERMQLWRLAFPEKARLAEDVSLEQIARRYKLSGADIMNVVQYACLQALDSGAQEIDLPLIEQGIRREYAKEGKMA